MATNKRKDAAALFELIDKSTLKVPKGAGSLKIPSWWSSKTNPASPGVAGGASRVGLGTEDESGGVAPPPLAKVEGGVVRTGAGDVSPQQRLFEPPPANEEPGVSPSIRPPGPGGAGRVTGDAPVVAPQRENAEVVGASGAGAGAGLENVEAKAVQGAGYAGSGTGQRVFAPQTMHQGGGQGGSQGQVNRPVWTPRGVKLAALPPWALAGGGVAVLLVLGLIVYALVPSHRGKSAVEGVGSSGGAVVISPGNGGHAADGGGAAATVGPVQAGGNEMGQSQNNVPTAPAAVEANDGAAHVYKGGTVPHQANLYYIWITESPVEATAEKDADFLAQHGIDVSVEILPQKKSKSVVYQLISVKGFPTLAEAERYRLKIVKIGHLTTDWKRTGRAWDDARSGPVRAAAK